MHFNNAIYVLKVHYFITYNICSHAADYLEDKNQYRDSVHLLNKVTTGN